LIDDDIGRDLAAFLEEHRACGTLDTGITGEPERVWLECSCGCLRHTFASLLLRDDGVAQHVQEQLGHLSLLLTTSTCGVKILNRRSGSTVVAKGRRRGRGVEELRENQSEPCWTRTNDPL
jgi:hypothetical protein